MKATNLSFPRLYSLSIHSSLLFRTFGSNMFYSLSLSFLVFHSFTLSPSLSFIPSLTLLSFYSKCYPHLSSCTSSTSFYGTKKLRRGENKREEGFFPLFLSQFSSLSLSYPLFLSQFSSLSLSYPLFLSQFSFFLSFRRSGHKQYP